MARTYRFLSVFELDEFQEARVNGVSSFDLYDEVIQRVRQIGGDQIADLFARPSVVRGNGVQPTRVTWATPLSGEVLPWRDASAELRERIAAMLGGLEGALARVLSDPAVGSAVTTWLNIPSMAFGLMIVGSAPVFINWGLLPREIAGDEAARARHFASGIGRFFPNLSPPPLEADTTPRPPAGMASAANGPAESLRAPGPMSGAASIAAAEAPPVAGATSAAEAASPVHRAAVAAVPSASLPAEAPAPAEPWLPWAIAIGVAAAVLAYLLLPGVLRSYAIAPSDLSTQATGQIVETLQQRQKALADALARPDVCAVIAPSLPTSPTSPAAAVAPDAPPLLAPPAHEVQSPAAAPPEANPQQAGDLVGYLDQATVMVMSVKPGDGQVGLGSGFFVSDSHVVTNRHVVEGGDPNRIIIARAGTAAPLRGRVVATSASSDIGADDFAVIEVAPDRSRRSLSLTSQVARRTDVVAAGYPAFVMATDAAFQRLLDGRGERVPTAVITQGSVMAVQESASGGPALVVHSATIAKGNSGGPLVDLCGRLVGVNTFGRHEEETALRLNFSLQSAALQRFLVARGIPARSDDSPCRPQIKTEAAPPTAPDASSPPASPPPTAETTPPPSSPHASPPPQRTPGGAGAAASPPVSHNPGQ